MCFLFILSELHFHLYERKERVLLYFIVERIEGSFFFFEIKTLGKEDIRVFTRVHSSLLRKRRKNHDASGF